MISLGELRLPATMESIRMVAHFIQGIGQRLDITEKTQFDIDLAVEEAVVNIITHAYPDATSGQLLISASSQGDMLTITLIDWGVPLNPEDIIPFDKSSPIELRIDGGMGLHFIQSLMDEVSRYPTPLGEPNRLVLVKYVERRQPGVHAPSVARELNAMLTISRTLSAGVTLDKLLGRIINTLVEVIDAERGTLYLIDEDKNELYSTVLLEDKSLIEEIRVKVGEGIAGHVAATGTTLNIRRAYEDPRFKRTFDEITGFESQTVLTLPMFNNRKKIIGVVQLLNKRGGDFTSRDERLLGAMASQAAISIENTRLYAQEIQQKLIEQDLETARRIQRSFLPYKVPQHSDWDIAAFWQPMREVGGDFYDFHLLPDGRLAVVIADVSGKGVPAAMFMALSVTVLRFAMSLDFTPADLLTRANQLILEDQQSRMFATVFVCYIDLETGEVQFGSAGHNPPMHYVNSEGKCELLSAPGVAMGVFPTATYAEITRVISHGDILVLYTDGITEVINADEEEFGEERLEMLISNNRHLSAQDLSDLVVSTITEFSMERGFDDETLLVLKRH